MIEIQNFLRVEITAATNVRNLLNNRESREYTLWFCADNDKNLLLDELESGYKPVHEKIFRLLCSFVTQGVIRLIVSISLRMCL